jgi:phosphatidylglycerol:prolipoprotein diacylglycerol transferase
MQWTANPAVHQFFEIAGYVAGVAVYTIQRLRRGDTVSDAARATAFTGAAVGAMLGARLLVLFSNPGGKTIVGGLLGGLIGVEIAKKLRGVTRSTGDLFVEPLIVAICIGRIGCFLLGPLDRTEGLPSSLPWAIAIADGVPRHPVALYEIAFLLLLFAALRIARPAREGDRFRIFMTAYLAFRLLVDFLKAGAFSAIQWACVAGLVYYALVLTNDSRHASVPFLRRRRVDLHDVLSED